MITIDPNLRGCGVALWDEQFPVLRAAAYVENPVQAGRGYECHVPLALAVNDWVGKVRGFRYGKCIVEMPRVYPGMPKTDLNDLLDVAGVGGAVSAALSHAPSDVHIVHVFPSEWKGNMPKQDMLKRIRSKLSGEEILQVQKTNKSDTEDILDAIGIGLWRLGRLNARVFPGAEP